jgi:arsenite/tail-anchored protein-transporting ATPase
VLLSRWWRARRDGAANTVTQHARAAVTFFGGKGGVGKTTCAAAYALRIARAGRRTLLISTDPAHSLGDLLQTQLTPSPQAVAPALDALELDPDRALRAYIDMVKTNLRELASPELRSAAEHQADLAALAPGSVDSAMFDEVVRILLDVGPAYDALVFDTAPTGHTLQLLALPEIMSAWTDALLERRRRAFPQPEWAARAVDEQQTPEDRAAAILNARQQRYATTRTLLLNPTRTRFVPVLNPDALSREETRRMVGALGARGIPIDTLIVNRVLPAHDTGAFYMRRRVAEAHHLAAIDKEFAVLRRLRVTFLPDEPRGLAALEPIAAQLPLEPVTASTSDSD